MFFTFPQNKLKIVKDIEAKEEELKNRNIILFGALSHNAIIEKVKNSFPVVLGNDFLEIKGRKYEGSDICLIMNVPNPFNKDKEALVVWSTDPSIFSKPFGIPLDIPLHYLILKGDFSTLGNESVLEAGFFYEREDRTYEAF